MPNKKSITPTTSIKTPLKILNIKQQYHKQIEEVANELDNAIKQHKLLKECIKNKPFCRGFIVSEKVIIKPDILVLGKRPTWYKKHDKYQNHIVEYWCPVLPPEESCSNKNQKLTIFENNKYQLLVEKDFIAPIFAKYFNNKNCKFLNLNFTFLDLYWLRCNGEELDSLLKNQETSKILEKQLCICLDIIKKIEPYAILFISDAQNVLKNNEKKKIIDLIKPESIEIHEYSFIPDLFLTDNDIKKIYNYIQKKHNN